VIEHGALHAEFDRDTFFVRRNADVEPERLEGAGDVDRELPFE
jgi:hypothetical protein